MDGARAARKIMRSRGETGDKRCIRRGSGDGADWGAPPAVPQDHADATRKGGSGDVEAMAVARRYWWPLLIFRLANALVVQTYFNPDEYWQGPEIAHRMAFGYGYQTWEWKDDARLRGYAHPMVFAVTYKLVALLGMDSRWVVAVLPRLIQGAAAAIGDVYLFLLAHRLFGMRTAVAAVGLHLTSWFSFYCSVRTFSNSLEEVATVAALYYWPLKQKAGPAGPKDGSAARAGLLAALALAALACLLRPTSVLTWAYLGAELFYRAHGWRSQLVFKYVLPTGAAALGFGCVVDRIGYGAWTLVPWNFARFNLISGSSALYGTHPWHWYLSQGFPAVIFPALPVFVLGATVAPAGARELLRLMGWTVAMLSTAPHKEFRFLMPLLPVACMFAAVGLEYLQRLSVTAKARDGILKTWAYTGSLVLLVAINLPMAAYMSLAHQRGPVSAAWEIGRLAESWENVTPMSVHFWTGCHATPFYSVVHSPIDMQILECPPSARLSVEGSEASRFDKDPEAFLRQKYAGDAPLPTHAVMFDTQAALAQSFLEEHGFETIASFFHSHVAGDADATDQHARINIFARHVP